MTLRCPLSVASKIDNTYFAQNGQIKEPHHFAQVGRILRRKPDEPQEGHSLAHGFSSLQLNKKPGTIFRHSMSNLRALDEKKKFVKRYVARGKKRANKPSLFPRIRDRQFTFPRRYLSMPAVFEPALSAMDSRPIGLIPKCDK